MTRNNLADHLIWLLRNTSLSKPTSPAFPSNSDPSSLEFSQSQSQSQSQSRSSLQNSQSRSNTQSNPSARTSSRETVPGNAHGLSTAGDALEDICEVKLEDGTMGRLTSATKAKKPSLLSKDLLPTPAPTTEQRPLKRTRDTVVPTAGTWRRIQQRPRH